MRLTSFACCLLLPLASAFTPTVASAQSDVGLTAVPTGGTRVGTYCRAVTCSALPVTASRGSSISFTTWGAIGGSYLLALGAPTKTCVAVPGFGNGLMLGPPILVFQGGVTGKGTSIAVCLIGQHSITVPIPSNTATGTIHVQALAQSASAKAPAFTPTLALTIK